MFWLRQNQTASFTIKLYNFIFLTRNKMSDLMDSSYDLFQEISLRILEMGKKFSNLINLLDELHRSESEIIDFLRNTCIQLRSEVEAKEKIVDEWKLKAGTEQTNVEVP